MVNGRSIFFIFTVKIKGDDVLILLFHWVLNFNKHMVWVKLKSFLLSLKIKDSICSHEYGLSYFLDLELMIMRTGLYFMYKTRFD